MQNLQFTAHPDWDEMQIVARRLGGQEFLGLLHAITVGHPDGLHTLSIGEADQVTDRAIDRDKALIDCRESHAIALGDQPGTQGLWQRGDVFQGGNALAVESMKELARAERRPMKWQNGST